MSSLLKIYQELYANDADIFPITILDLTLLVQDELTKVEVQEKQKLFLERSLVFEQFSQCMAEDRDGITENIFHCRKRRDELNMNQFDNVHLLAFVNALKIKNKQSIRLHADHLISSLPELQKYVWLALCEFPYAFFISDFPDLVAIRILPDFCNGSPNFRKGLCEYLKNLCQIWEEIEEEEEIVEFLNLNSQNSPLCRVECGVWWARILLEGCLKNNHQRNTKKVTLSIESLKEVCSPHVSLRELAAYGF